MQFSNINLILSSISYIFFIPIDGILYMQWANSMINYKWLLASIFVPLGNIMIFAPFYIFNKYKNRNINNNNWTNSFYNIFNPIIIKDEQNDNLADSNKIAELNKITEINNSNNDDISKIITIPQNKIFIIALLQYTNNFLFIISVTNISYFINLVLGKLSIIMIMLLSYIFLERRYRYNHCIGMILILLGMALPLINQFNNNNNNNIFYIFLNIGSVFLHSVCNVYQEKYIKKIKNLNIFIMNYWINIWQLIIGICSFPLVFIPLEDINIPIDSIGLYLNNGLQCQFIGYDNVIDNHCKYAFLYAFFNETIYILVIFLMFNIFKYGSSVVYQLLSFVKMPISTVLTYYLIKYKIIYATKSQEYNLELYDYLSIVFITLGTIIYIIYPEITNDQIHSDLQEGLLEET